MGPSKPDRAASRLRRGAANEWGFGGHVVAPKTRARRSRVTAPPGTADEWGFGGQAVAPKTRARQGRVTVSPGRGERLGVWGSGRGPQNARRTEARHGFAGARRTFGGLGAMSWPQI